MCCYLSQCVSHNCLTGGYGLPEGDKWASLYRAHRWSAQNVMVVDHSVSPRGENVVHSAGMLQAL